MNVCNLDKNGVVRLYDELNSLWDDAEKHFSLLEVRIPVSVDTQVGMKLAWMKHGNPARWRIVVENGEGEKKQTKLILETPIYVRVEMTAYLHELKLVLLNAKELAMESIIDACYRIREFLEDVD